jgi:hypothetical protein
MWLLSFLPDTLLMYIVNIVLIAGIISFILAFFVLHKILNKIPGLSKYVTVIQIVSAVLLTAGIYFKGGYTTEMMWRDRVKELEAKVAAAEAESKKENVVIQEKIVKQKEYIQGKTEYITKYIDKLETKEVIKEVQGPERVRVEEVIKYIENCPVPKELINIHNDAAILNKAAKDPRK